jgi:hypothetical protein
LDIQGMLLLFLSIFCSVRGSNLVLSWSDVALDAIRFNKSSPPISSRALAIVGVAVHDALASVSTRYNGHAYSLSNAPDNTSLEAVVIASARTSLAALYPNQVAKFDAKYFSDLAALGDSLSVSNGVYVGTVVANAVLADRARDGYLPYVPYPGSNNTGKWRPTPPAFAPAEVSQWADMKPWCLSSDSEFRPPPPPDVYSAAYIADHNQIAVLGAKFNSTRTQEQSDIAAFWYDGPATDTPPGTWDTVSDQISSSKGYDLIDSAYLGALLGMTLADCAIMGWDAKYTYGQWRPVTAIQYANTVVPQTNPPLAYDSNWTPLLNTPNWPDYISDRVMFGGGASQLLARLFGDQYTFSITSDALGTTRIYTRFSDAAFEQGQSRVFAGSHFNTSCVLGVEYGKKVADWSFDNCIRPRAATTAGPSTTTAVRSTTPAFTAATTNYTSVIVGAVIGGTLGIIFLILFAAFVISFKRAHPNRVATVPLARHDFDGVQ